MKLRLLVRKRKAGICTLPGNGGKEGRRGKRTELEGGNPLEVSYLPNYNAKKETKVFKKRGGRAAN